MTSSLKNKKIAAYIALEHHVRFIIPVMEKLKSLGVKQIYIVGQAERSQEITAIENNLNYVHVFDYLKESDQDDVLENYRFLRDGFAKGVHKDIAIGSSSMLTVLDKNLYAAAKEYVGFRNFFKKEKPDLCFALHEVNRWGKMLAFWAKKNNIPFLSMQEGLPMAKDFCYIGHIQYAAFNMVWGERTRKKFIGYESPPDRVIPVGNTHIAQEIEMLKKNNTREKMLKRFKCHGKKVILLLFSSMPSEIKDLFPILSYLGPNNNFKLIIKFHTLFIH